MVRESRGLGPESRWDPGRVAVAAGGVRARGGSSSGWDPGRVAVAAG